MQEKRTSVFENGLIWFGAAVSIAEILTGTYFAPLGFGRGLAAIVLGHIIGCAMLFAAGLIGGQARRSAMETVKMSFGQKGSLLFVVLNIVQLVGWTGIMIFDGALAANGVWALGNWLWCLVIGGLIVLWILIGIENLGKINTVAMGALFVLTIILSFVIFGKGTMHAVSDDAMSFGAAVELSVAMPLSWLPLISDYTREAEKPVKATAASAIVYGLVSCWMSIRLAQFAQSTSILYVFFIVNTPFNHIEHMSTCSSVICISQKCPIVNRLCKKEGADLLRSFGCNDIVVTTPRYAQWCNDCRPAVHA